MNKDRPKDGRRQSQVIVIIAILVLLAAAAIYLLPNVHLDESALSQWVNSLGFFAPVATIGLMVLHSFLPIPGEIVAVLNGMLFGAIFGVVYTWLGAMLGAYLCFFISKKWGRRLFGSLFPSVRVEQLSFWKSVGSPWTLLLIRLIPFISFNLINYALGLSSISLWRFTWTTAIGILPGIILSVTLGDSVAKSNIWLTIGSGGILVIVLASMWIRKTKKPDKKRPFRAQ